LGVPLRLSIAATQPSWDTTFRLTWDSGISLGAVEGDPAALDQFEQQFPQIQVQRTGKFVDEGPIITAAALTAGFHMALHVVERLLGEQMAQAVAKGIDMEGL